MSEFKYKKGYIIGGKFVGLALMYINGGHFSGPIASDADATQWLEDHKYIQHLMPGPLAVLKSQIVTTPQEVITL